MLSPLYISEIAPAKIRGKLISLNQIGIVSGIVLIYLVNYLIARMGDEAWNSLFGWRWMFASEIIPALVFLFLLLQVPESPRWLAKQNRYKEALHTLMKVNAKERALKELEDIKSTIGEKKVSISALFKPELRTTLIIGVFLSIFAQTTGINAIMYYAPEIFKEAGFGYNSALFQTIFIGINNLIFSFMAFWLVDKIGRKALLLVGAAGMVLNHFLIGGAFFLGYDQSPFLLVFILIFGAFFSASYGPVTWIVMAEIFPTRVRGRAMSISTVAIWAACYIVSQTFPMLLETIGAAFTFWFFMTMVLISFLFVWKILPETKGKTLEDIEKSWKKKN